MGEVETSAFGSLEAVIFDLDGVLVSSIPAHFEAFRRTFAEEGREFTWEDYMRLGAGASRELLIRRVMGEGLHDEIFERLMRRKVDHVEAVIAERGLSQIDGAREFVDQVLARGLKTAVATSSRTPKLLLEGAGMWGLFEIVVDRNDVQRPKPDPEIFLLAAERLDVQPARCVVLEDSPLGVESGIRAGMRVVALTTSEPPARLSAAHSIVDRFDEIDLGAWT